VDKDTKKVLAEAERQGFTVRTTSRGHAQVHNADGQVVAVFSGSASDVRALRNGIAELRRAGFVWPPKKGR
jgi:hypothetical protein